MEVTSGLEVESGPPAAHPREAARRLLKAAAILSLVVIVVAAHYYLSDKRLDYTGPLAPLDRIFDILLALYLLALSAAAGSKVSSLVKVPYAAPLERLLFSTALGVGIISYLVLALGLVGLLNLWAVASMLLLITLILRRELLSVMREGAVAVGEVVKSLRLLQPAGDSGADKWGRAAIHIVWGLAIVLLLLVLLRALMPPYDWDGLMYHLSVPKVYVELGRIVPMTWPLQANSPFTINMLYTVGLLFQSDGTAIILELFFLILTCLALYSAASRWFDGMVGALAVLLFLSSNLALMMASQSTVDMAFTYFEFLSIYALILWATNKGRTWLLVAGGLTGLAMGIKFVGLQTFVAVNLFVLGLIAYRSRGQLTAMFAAGRDLVVFDLLAILVASPWYVKNQFWLGNPVYPRFFGGLDWDLARQKGLELAVYSYGLGHDWLNTLLLPWNILAHTSEFMFFPPPFAFYLLLPCALAFRRRHQVVTYLLVLSGLHLLVWTLQDQDLRLLLPIYPALTVASAYGLRQFGQWVNQRLKPLVVPYLLLPIFGIALASQILTMKLSLAEIFPTWELRMMAAVALGLEPRKAYLQHASDNYGAVEYLNATMSPPDKALFLWDGKWYYMQGQTIPDDVNYGFGYFQSLYGSYEGIIADWHRRGVTYVLVNRHVLSIMERDGDLRRLSAGDFDDFSRRYLELVYRDRLIEVYKVRVETSAAGGS